MKTQHWKIIAYLFSLFGANDLGQLGGDVEGHLQPSQLLLGLLSHVGQFSVGMRLESAMIFSESIACFINILVGC